MYDVNSVNLTQKQAQALPLLAIGGRPTEVAKTVGVAPQTVSEWLHQNAEFKNALCNEQDKIRTEARGQLIGLVKSAVDELQQLVMVGKSEQVRLKAITYILDKVEGMNLTESDATNKAVELNSLLTILEKFYGGNSSGEN